MLSRFLPDRTRERLTDERTWLTRLITRRERPQDFARALERRDEDIKVVVQFAEA